MFNEKYEPILERGIISDKLYALSFFPNFNCYSYYAYEELD